MKQSKALYGISRIDDPIYRTYAWRVSLRRQNRLFVKNFTDKQHGGKQRALAAAKAYRDEFVKKHPPTTRQQFCATLRRHNTSGIPGVYRYAKPYVLADGEVRKLWYWETTWPTPEGGSTKATFSVKQYGEEKAKQLAIAAREAGVRKLRGVCWAAERGAA